MIDLLIAAALAEASATASSVHGELPASAITEIRVEAPRRTRPWNMPELDYRTVQQCIFWWESELPGFGTVSFGPQCADRDSDASFQ